MRCKSGGNACDDDFDYDMVPKESCAEDGALNLVYVCTVTIQHFSGGGVCAAMCHSLCVTTSMVSFMLLLHPLAAFMPALPLHLEVDTCWQDNHLKTELSKACFAALNWH